MPFQFNHGDTDFVDSWCSECNNPANGGHMRSKRIILVVFSVLLFIVAALAWLSYVGQGIAYGDLFGIRGREADLAALGRGAMRSLWIAASCESLAVGLITWVVSDPDSSVWGRLVTSSGVALFVDICTYAVVRGM